MIKLADVYKVYENGTRALRGVSMTIRDGEFAFLVGPSGSGKSSIIKLITGEEDVTEGKLMVNGYNMLDISSKQLPGMRRTLGVVFQDFRLIKDRSIYDNLVLPMRVVGASPNAIRRRVPYVLNLVGLNGKEKQMPQQISGGEQQRVAIARALINNPSVIIADEPTGNLDPRRSLEIMKLLQEINRLGTTLLVVTHERELVNRFDKRVIAIEGGKIISDGAGGYYNNGR